MKLLPKDIEKKLPKLCEQERFGDDAVVYLKFFDPCGSWTWYVTEFDGSDTFFGFVIGHFPEYGYFSLKELMSVRNKMGLPIERDLHFTPKTVREIKYSHGVDSP